VTSKKQKATATPRAVTPVANNRIEVKNKITKSAEGRAFLFEAFCRFGVLKKDFAPGTMPLIQAMPIALVMPSMKPAIARLTTIGRRK